MNKRKYRKQNARVRNSSLTYESSGVLDQQKFQTQREVR